MGATQSDLHVLHTCPRRVAGGAVATERAILCSGYQAIMSMSSNS